MIPYIDLPPIYRGIFSFVAFWACGLGMITFCYATLLKKWWFFAGGVVNALVGFFFIETAYEVSLYKMNGTGNSFAVRLGNMPHTVLVCILLLVTICSFSLFMYQFINRKKVITYTSVKEALNKLPSGLCYYYPGGRILYTNRKMLELSQKITNSSLLNGEDLYRSLRNNIYVFEDDEAYFFTQNSMEFEGRLIFELIAVDITNLYKNQLKLTENNIHLEQLNKKLKAYNLNLAASIREKEILQTKINIHDETNRLLLATHNALNNETSDTDKLKILNTWQQNILMLCKEAGMNANDDVFDDLISLANSLGIKLTINGALNTDDENILSLFTLSSREAMINAIKHGNAKEMIVETKESDDEFTFIYTNDGKVPKKAIKAAGGLTNLEAILSPSKGRISFSTSKNMKLIVSVPKPKES